MEEHLQLAELALVLRGHARRRERALPCKKLLDLGDLSRPLPLRGRGLGCRRLCGSAARHRLGTLGALLALALRLFQRPLRLWLPRVVEVVVRILVVIRDRLLPILSLAGLAALRRVVAAAEKRWASTGPTPLVSGTWGVARSRPECRAELSFTGRSFLLACLLLT